MAKQQKRWVYSPTKPAKPKIPDVLKAQVEVKGQHLVDTYLKPTYVKPPPEEQRFNYLVDIFARWYRGCFYFYSKYACPGPNAIAPFFEDKFARLEYVGDDRFNLAFMRYTGQWIELGGGLSLDDCLNTIKEGGWFTP